MREKDMVRTSEGGSILSFVVVGAILTFLLVASVYAVRQHFVSGQASQATGTATPSEKNDQQKPVNEGGAATTKPESSQQPATTAKPEPTVEVTPPSASATPATQLPQTGPVSTLVSVIGVALLTASFVAYLRSRRYQLPYASV